MKLTEFPEREERMKNYRSARRNLYMYIALLLIFLVGSTSAFPKSDLSAAIAATFFILAAVAIMGRVIHDLSRIPNGLPRPEDELPRGKLYRVHSRIDNRLTLWDVPSRDDDKPVFWEFENLPPNVESDRQIVYLDDLESEYLAKWKEDGVIPILSAQGRAKLNAKKAAHTEARNRFSEATS